MAIQSTGDTRWSVATALVPAEFASLFPEHGHLGLRTCLGSMGGFSTPRLPERLAWADFQQTALYPGRLRQGSGRAVFHDGYYLKGVGRTALAANWAQQRDTAHATGHLAPSAAARELLISRYMKCKGLSGTIVPCEGLLVSAMEREFAAAYTSSMASAGRSLPACDRELQAISVKRDDFARWSNLVWLANQMPAEADSVISWCSLAGHFARERVDGTPEPLVSRNWTARALAESLARAARRGIETLAVHVGAGVTWSSYHNNATLDGRFLDLELPNVLGEPALCRFIISNEPLVASTLPHHGVLFGSELLFEAQQIRVAVRTLVDRFRVLRSVATPASVADFLDELAQALEHAFGERHWVSSREQQRETLTELFEGACTSTSRARRAAEQAIAEFYEEDDGDTDVAGRLLPLALPAPESGMHIGAYLLDGGRCLESARARDERGAFLTSMREIEACRTPESYLDCVRAGLERVEAATAPGRTLGAAETEQAVLPQGAPEEIAQPPTQNSPRALEGAISVGDARGDARPHLAVESAVHDTRSFAEGAVLVVAHPDDEVLWFSSVVAEVDHIVICYLDEDFYALDDPRRAHMIRARRRAQAAYPLKNVTWLNVTGSGNFGAGVWDGSLSPHGVPLEVDVGKQGDYARAFEELVRGLEPLIDLLGPKRLLTHAPWGEYGHADHAQVFRAVEWVARTLGCALWVPNYCSAHTFEAAHAWSGGQQPSACVSLPCDEPIAHTLRDLYIEAGCWTWARDHEWFAQDTFFQPLTSSAREGSFSLNVVPQ